ncbi:MAG: phage portal protein [Bacillota bacterium]|nr:phage portal protein [Bacillota bacterium]
MAIFNFLDRFFTDSDTVSLKTVSKAAKENLDYKLLVMEAGINLISKAVSLAEFQTFEKGEETRKKNYYLFNVEANQNTSASAFWRDTVRTVLEKEEALVLLEGGSLYLADSFTRKQSAFSPNVYTDVEINGESVKGSFNESQVLYFRDNITTVRSAFNGLYNDYAKLISASSKGYRSSKARKGTLEIPTSLPHHLKDVEALQKYIEDTMKTFMDPDTDAVYPEQHNFKYNEIQETKGGSKASESGRETRKLIDDVIDFMAIAYGFSPALLKGDTVESKDIVNNFIAFCINPFAKLITDELNRKMYGYKHYSERSYVKADTSVIKTVDLRDIANSIDMLNRNAALRIDDILRMLGKEPIGGELGNMRFITKNYELLDRVLEEGSVSGSTGVNSSEGGD